MPSAPLTDFCLPPSLSPPPITAGIAAGIAVGGVRDDWHAWDPCHLVRDYLGQELPLLIDQVPQSFACALLCMSVSEYVRVCECACV